MIAAILSRHVRAIVIAGVLLAGVALLWLAARQDGVHDERATVATRDAKAVAKATDRATSTLETERARNDANDKELSDAAATPTDAPAGPATRAVFDRMRDQQATDQR